MNTVLAPMAYYSCYLLAIATIACTLLFTATRKKSPIYEGTTRESLTSNAKKAFGGSVLIGALVALVQVFSPAGVTLYSVALVANSVIATFVLIVSWYTDFTSRRVDRVMLRTALAMSVALGALLLWELQSESFTVLYIVLLLLSFCVMFAPTIGASDARALMLLFGIGVPLYGSILTYYTFLGAVALILLYGVVSVIRTRNSKVSIPLVPCMIAPVVAALIYVSIEHAVDFLCHYSEVCG